MSKVAGASFKAFGKAAVKSMSSVASGMLRLTASMIGLGKSTKKTNNIFSGGLKNILKYGLGIRSLYALVNKLRTAIKEGFSNLYNEFDGFKNSVDGLKASLTTLQNSFAAAFHPLVEIAIPYIQKVVGYMTGLMDTVGQFVAALTGQKTYTRAVKQATTAMKDNAKATEEAKEAAEGYLSPLDEINKYQAADKKENDSGTGTDGVTGPMFEELPISDRFKNIVQWLEDMWENANFYELGQLLGERLKDALENIPWDKIKETARKLGKSIASLINGFIEVEDLGKTIGKTLAEKINTGYEFLNAFVHELHWDSVGKFIADSISGFLNGIDWNLIYDTFVTGAKGLGDAVNSFVDNLDWKAISMSISNFVRTFVDTVYTFITTVDWKELGAKLGTTISDAWKGVNWSKAGETVGEAFKAFLDFISGAIENIDWHAVGETVKDFLAGIDWAGVSESLFESLGVAFGGGVGSFLGGIFEDVGKDIILGLLFGVGYKIKDIGEWIKEHIFQPFIDGFKKAFGIASPSKVMEEMGVYIIEGLLNGVKSLVDSVTQIWEDMKATASQIWEEVNGNLSTTWENIKQDASTVWNGIKGSLTRTWDSMKQTASTTFENIKSSISEKWGAAKNTTTTAWGGIKSTLSGIWSNIKTAATNAFTGIKNGVVSAWENLRASTSRIWQGISSAVKTPINGIIGFLNRLISAMATAVNSIAKMLNSMKIDIPDWVPGIGGGKLRFNLPTWTPGSIPYLAKGTVVPPNKEFLAVLGDNTREHEVVSPLSTIKQAQKESLMEVLSELGLTGGRADKGNTYSIKAEANRKVLFELLIEEGKLSQMSTGRNPFLLGY